MAWNVTAYQKLLPTFGPILKETIRAAVEASGGSLDEPTVTRTGSIVAVVRDAETNEAVEMIYLDSVPAEEPKVARTIREHWFWKARFLGRKHV